MVFSPDPDNDIMLGTAAPATHTFSEDEFIGGHEDGDSESENSGVINEDLDSLGDLLSSVMKQDSKESEDEEE